MTMQLSFDGMAPSLEARVAIQSMEETELPFHPLANVFPLLEGAEFTALVADIQQHGVLEPIWLYEGQLLEGRNRYRACQELGIACPSRLYDGDDPVGFVVSLNVHRRHLDESQRAMVAARLATMRQGERTDLPSIEGRLSQEDAAQLLHVGVPTVERANKIQREGALEVIQAVDAGEIKVSSAVELTALPKEEQAAVFEEIKRDVAGKKPTAQHVRTIVHQKQGIAIPSSRVTAPNGIPQSLTPPEAPSESMPCFATEGGQEFEQESLVLGSPNSETAVSVPLDSLTDNSTSLDIP
jgi:ParB-like chromosome segregation protein Spo0J